MDGKEHGFTLIELCITLVVMGIISGIAGPPMASLILRMRADTLMSAMTVDFATARMRAISKNTDVVVCPGGEDTNCQATTNWLDGWMVFEDKNGNRRRDPSETVVSVHQKGKTGSLQVNSTAGRKYIVYRPDGFSMGANLTVSYCIRAGLHGKLVVNNGGRVRTERPAKPTACPT